MSSSSVYSYLMEFVLSENIGWDKLLATVRDTLQAKLSNLELLTNVTLEAGSENAVAIFKGSAQSLITVRFQSPKSLLLTFETFGPGSPVPNLEAAQKLENELKSHLACDISKCLCPIKRGGPLDPYRYLTSSDDRLLEYDVVEVLADVHSAYQHILILNTLSFGNLLVLDGLQNLAESDLVYTETLMQRGKLDYAQKRVLILGGGDGALLWELLQEKPEKVTMIEIDDQVMQLCRQHLRSACGTALDQYEGPHHQIIVGDCLQEMDQMLASGQKFDFIFGDLTDIPLSTTGAQQEQWELLKTCLEKSLQLLDVNGKFLTHGNGTSSKEALDNFEVYLSSVKPAVAFSRCQAYVPSFMEDWVFYQIWNQVDLPKAK
nr:EOG090X07PL [Triops cancriformis]